MKKVMLLFMLCLTSIISNAQKATVNYSIDNIKDFSHIQFYTEDYDTIYHSQDTLGNFKYELNKENPSEIYFAVNDNYKHEGILYIENEALSLNISSKNGYDVQIEDAPNTNLVNEVLKFQKNSSIVYMQIFKQMLTYKEVTAMYNYWGKEYEKYRNKTDSVVNVIYSNHKDKFATLSYCYDILE